MTFKMRHHNKARLTALAGAVLFAGSVLALQPPAADAVVRVQGIQADQRQEPPPDNVSRGGNLLAGAHPGTFGLPESDRDGIGDGGTERAVPPRQLAASQESQPLTGNAEADYDDIGDSGTERSLTVVFPV